MDHLAHVQTLLPPSDLPFAKQVLEQNVSHENHLISMQMTEHHTSSFPRRLVLPQIGLFIHELLREPLICVNTTQAQYSAGLLRIVVTFYTISRIFSN